RGLDALAHGTTERDAGGELLGDALGNELSVDLCVLDLEDVELDLLASQLLEARAELVSLGAAAADDDAGTCGVEVHAHTLTGALDLHLGHAGTLEALGHELTNLDILVHVVAVALAHLGGVGEPARTVVGRDAQAVAVRVNLLTHYRAPSLTGVATT